MPRPWIKQRPQRDSEMLILQGTLKRVSFIEINAIYLIKQPLSISCYSFPPGRSARCRFIVDILHPLDIDWDLDY